MNARVVIGWLEGRIARSWTGDPDDLADWLACDDDALIARENERRVGAIVAAGGEIG